jgi:alpha-1,3-rhamnosyl/mannosyltransferase
MRVTLCVDALQPELTGIGRYTWELWNGLSKRAEICSLLAYRGDLLISDPARLLTNENHRPGHRWMRPALRRSARKALQSTLVHGPNYFLPTEAPSGVITIHDLSVFRFPETHPASRLSSFERQFASSLQRAAHVITDTETIRRELIDAFSLAPQSVTAVPLGVDLRFRRADHSSVGSAVRNWGLSSDAYALSVAAFEPRKKISELIAAWSRLPSKLRGRYPLVLAGAAGWQNEDLHQQILSAESEGWLKHLGFVDDRLLPQLYAGARLFVYPSIYEGFGLPPVEAMASGTPVIVSNRSCLPEVCGEAARYIDPADPDAFTAAIEESLTDDEWRTEMIPRGLERARMYSWDRCIENTVAIYRKAMTSSD